MAQLIPCVLRDGLHHGSCCKHASHVFPREGKRVTFAPPFSVSFHCRELQAGSEARAQTSVVLSNSAAGPSKASGCSVGAHLLSVFSFGPDSTRLASHFRERALLPGSDGHFCGALQSRLDFVSVQYILAPGKRCLMSLSSTPAVSGVQSAEKGHVCLN